MELIRLEKTNLESLRQLNEVFAEAFEDPDTHLSKKPSDSYLTNLLSDPNFIALAAIEADKTIGGITAYVLKKYEQERSEIYLYDLAVALPYRRRGIATSLIEYLKGIAKEIGAWVIFVQADQEDVPAIRLYESLGTKEAPFHFDIQP